MLSAGNEFKEVVCRPLRYDEISKAVDVTEEAFRDNPLVDYLHNTPDARDSRLVRIGRKAASMIQSSHYVRSKEMLGINGGDGSVMYRSPLTLLSQPRRVLERTLRVILMAILSVCFRLINSREQWQRFQETRKKGDAAAKDSIGDQIEDMFAIDLLAVAPEKQRIGYGSALVGAVTAKADAHSKGTWLITRPPTAGFYERLSFTVVGEYTLGESNPTWTKPPVEMVVMVREPKLLDMYSNLEKGFWN
ncbi:hypothetical protein BKA93DRAFT_302224 [Sparassis latifolia]|uniref:N-acetyltransferase domain-containing protein n=1 Tax=Sparassis crispa TaxID=139825 RepID=A0A401G7N9_9APHY|nr:hypothetical protein SCP_0110520 [Sparassis crispa]GBE78169.1 hypothetical protein SCP_0110520 [Sparassis crispa]